MASSTDFSEKSAEAVRIYPCLYDKASPDFKDNKKKNLAWQDVAKAVGIENQVDMICLSSQPV